MKSGCLDPYDSNVMSLSASEDIKAKTNDYKGVTENFCIEIQNKD
jgi:hypothetical protein